MANLTPLLLVAGVGLLKNSGLTVNSSLSSNANTFTSSGTSGACLNYYSNATDSGKSILSQLPSCLSGLSPAGTPNQGTNLVGGIITSAGQLVSKGVQGFTSILGQASSYAATTFGFQGALAQAKGLKFDDLGFTFNNYTDLTSGGITSQFSADTVSGIAAELPRLGTLFDVSDLYNMANPGSICTKIIYYGLGYAGSLQSKLEDAGLNLDDLVNENQTVIVGIMATVNGSDLRDIFAVTEFNPFVPDAITTLADVLDINNVLGPAVTGEIDSFDALANKLGNIGGTFKDPAEMADFYSGIEIQSFPTLASMGTLLPSGFGDDIGDIVGTGAGVFGNPTALDIVGSASGIGYTDNIATCVNLQQDLVNNNQNVRNLIDYLETNGDEVDEATLQGLVNQINGDPGIQRVIDTGNDSMIEMANKITAEQKNQLIAGVKLGNDMLPGSVGGVMSLSSQLPGMALDPMSLGLGSLVTNMASDDMYGEALQASIVESKNLNRFSVFGIEPGTKMDPAAYAKSLSGMI
jgi:hypothetical protein